MTLDSSLNYLAGDWVDEVRTGEPGTATDSGESWRVDLDGRVLIRMGWCEFPASSKRAAYRHEDLLVLYSEGDEMHGIFWDNEGHTIHYRDVNVLPAGQGVVLVSDRALPGPRQQLLYSFEPPNRLSAKFSLLLPGAADFTAYLTWTSKRSEGKPTP